MQRRHLSALSLSSMAALIAAASLSACGSDTPAAPPGAFGANTQNNAGTTATAGAGTTGGAGSTGPVFASQPNTAGVPGAQPMAGTTSMGGAAAQPMAGAAAVPGTAGARPMPGAGAGGTVAVPVAGTAPVAEPAAAEPAAAEPAAAEPEPAGGEGVDIVPNKDGWVGASTNGVGVVGSWFDFLDDSGTTGTMTVVDGVVCIEGTTAAMADAEDYDTFGAGIGFTLNKEDAWDGSGYEGLAFTAEVDSDAVVTVEMAMVKGAATDEGSEHFTTLTSGSKSLDWSDFEQPDWVVDAGDDVDLEPEELKAIQFKIKADEDGEHDYKVCISEMKVME